MAIKTTLTVDVNDAAFQQYKAVFDRYQASVAKIPGDWAKVAEGVKASKTSFDDLVAELVQQNLQTAQYNAAQKQADQLVKSQSIQWKSMAQSTGNIAKTVFHATETLLKWVGPVAMVSGLLGAAGGLFGFDRLAGSVSSGRRSASGLGATYGQMQSFGLNYSPLIDANSLLGNVSRGIYDKTSPQYNALMAAHISPEFIASHTAAEVSAEFLHRLPGIMARVPRGLTGATGLGFDSLMSDQDLVAYLSASPRERADREKAWTKDSRSLNLDDSTQRGYTDFLNQLSRAGQAIETSLVKGLAQLAVPLSRISDSLIKLITETGASDAFKHFIDAVGGALQSLANYISTPEFEKRVEAFGTWILDMAGSLRWAVGQLITLGGGAQPATAPVDAQGFAHGATTMRRPGRGAPPGSYIPGYRSSTNRRADTGSSPTSSSAGSLTALINASAARYGVNPQIMEGIRAGESGHSARYDINDTNRESSWGPFQLNRRNGLGVQFERETGLDLRDPRTIPAQADWVAKYISKGGSLSPWTGYHGPRNADPSWGNSGYIPTPEASVPIGTVFSDDYGNLRIKGSGGSTTEPVSGGPAARGTIDLAHWLQDTDAHVQQFTSFRDKFHAFENPNSAHNKGLAFDAALSGESLATAAARVRQQMALAGLAEGGMGGGGDYAIEPPGMSRNHLHVQFNSVASAEKFYAYRHPANASDANEPGGKFGPKALRVFNARDNRWETVGVDAPEGGWSGGKDPLHDFRKSEWDNEEEAAKLNPADHRALPLLARPGKAPPAYQGAGVAPLVTIDNHLGSGATVTTSNVRWDR